jgi:hypothetical protein
VMGGALVLGITYIIWGFLAPRFTTPAIAPAREARREPVIVPGTVSPATPMSREV